MNSLPFLSRLIAEIANLNAFAERWVRTVKRECVRRLWFIGYHGLCEVLNEYVAHYNTERPHQRSGESAGATRSSAVNLGTEGWSRVAEELSLLLTPNFM